MAPRNASFEIVPTDMNKTYCHVLFFKIIEQIIFTYNIDKLHFPSRLGMKMYYYLYMLEKATSRSYISFIHISSRQMTLINANPGHKLIHKCQIQTLDHRHIQTLRQRKIQTLHQRQKMATYCATNKYTHLLIDLLNIILQSYFCHLLPVWCCMNYSLFQLCFRLHYGGSNFIIL